jgi:membrane associated rhomboid family serine protease
MARRAVVTRARERGEPLQGYERDETAIAQLDRHFLELLQELRVAQTGVQILFAFLLSLAFTPRFSGLSSEQRGLYLATLVLSAVSAGVLIAPVAYHRAVYRRRLRAMLVQTGHRCLRVGLLFLLLSLVGAVQLAAGFVLGVWSGPLTGALAAALLGLWYGLPAWHRRRRRPVGDGG